MRRALIARRVNFDVRVQSTINNQTPNPNPKLGLQLRRLLRWAHRRRARGLPFVFTFIRPVPPFACGPCLGRGMRGASAVSSDEDRRAPRTRYGLRVRSGSAGKVRPGSGRFEVALWVGFRVDCARGIFPRALPDPLMLAPWIKPQTKTKPKHKRQKTQGPGVKSEEKKNRVETSRVVTRWGLPPVIGRSGSQVRRFSSSHGLVVSRFPGSLRQFGTRPLSLFLFLFLSFSSSFLPSFLPFHIFTFHGASKGCWKPRSAAAWLVGAVLGGAALQRHDAGDEPRGGGAHAAPTVVVSHNAAAAAGHQPPVPQ